LVKLTGIAASGPAALEPVLDAPIRKGIDRGNGFQSFHDFGGHGFVPGPGPLRVNLGLLRARLPFSGPLEYYSKIDENTLVTVHCSEHSIIIPTFRTMKLSSSRATSAHLNG
jgi:hypothetical protein